MNEVMALGNELGIPMFYTDTDSIHKARCGGILEKVYLQRYGRELIGRGMGQFAYELKFPGHTNIYSQRAIFLGKKAYMHVVQGRSEKGEVETYYHCRMKGVNAHAMEEYPDKLALYERLYAGEKIAFDLTYGQAVMFQFKGQVSTREVYKKCISFKGEKGAL